MSENENVLDLVNIKPIVRKSWLPEGHDGEIRYTNCFERLMPVKSRLSKAYLTGLSDKEAESIEKKLRLVPGTLSPYNEDFWSNYLNGADIRKEGLTLNPNIPEDRIKIAWLMVHPRVANTENEKYDDPGYEYVMTSEIQLAETKNKKRAVLKTAILKLAELSLSEKIDVLKLYGKKVDNKTSEELIEDYVNTFVEEYPKDFLDIVEDTEFKTKILIKDSISCKALLLEGSMYKLNGGETIGHDIDSIIEYINDPEHAAIKKQLLAKVKLAKSKE